MPGLKPTGRIHGGVVGAQMTDGMTAAARKRANDDFIAAIEDV